MIASRASCRSTARSCGVYSGCGLESDWTGCDSSDCGDIALLAPAENESATPALDYMAIDLRPEGVEVISRRGQRPCHHEPDCETRDPVDGENIFTIHGELRPAVVENYCHHRNNLHHHFEFAEIAGFDSEPLGGGNRPQSADQKFAADDYNRNPGRNHTGVELNKRDECSGNKELVGQGVEQPAHGGNLPAPSGNVAVNAIGDRRGNEQCGC